MKLSKSSFLALIVLSVVICAVIFSACSGGKSQSAKNKETAIALFNEFFVEKKVEVVDKYIGTTYINHNPMAQNGPDAVKAFFQGFWKTFPEPVYSLKRVLADGDLVALHYHFQLNKDDRGFAIVDIFRFENGKIVEHWDVAQQVPEKSANDNTLF